MADYKGTETSVEQDLMDLLEEIDRCNPTPQEESGMEVSGSTEVVHVPSFNVDSMFPPVEEVIIPNVDLLQTPTLAMDMMDIAPENNTAPDTTCVLPNHSGALRRTFLQSGGGNGGGNDDDDDDDDDANDDVNDDADDDDDQAPSFTIRVKSTRDVKKFQSKEITHEVRLQSVQNSTWHDHLGLLGRALDTSLNQATADLHDDDLVRVFIQQDSLDTPIVVKLDKKRNISPHTILDQIEKVLQSKKQLEFNESFEINIGCIRLPRGGIGAKIIHKETAKIKKRSIIRIQNKDNMCLARAISVCMAYKFDAKNKTKIANSKLRIQSQKARDLCQKAGVDSETVSDLDDIQRFEEVLNVQIIVVGGQQLNRIIYKGSKVRLCKIFLYYDNAHFDAITNIKAFLAYRYFCDICLKGRNQRKHKCVSQCPLCYGRGCMLTSAKECTHCNRIFRNEDCFDRHKVKSINHVTRKLFPSICETLWKCRDCSATIQYKRRSPDTHRCHESFCNSCQVHYMDKHFCYILEKKPTKPSYRYLFFDLECRVDDNNVHVPNLAVIQKTCELCINIDIDDTESGRKCESCGERETVFQGENCADDFCSWLFSEQHRHFVAFAHNSKSYDSVFLLKYLVENAITPKVIFSGNKVMALTIPCLDLRVMDSYNHIATSLANFPKIFGISELKKGFFPHLFNTLSQESYVGLIPDVKYYCPDSMSIDRRDEFYKWYAEQQGKVFNFREEIYSYCKSDVDILRKSCLKYRELIIELTTPKATAIDEEEPVGIDPLQFVTIASLCFNIFRQNFLVPDTVARVPAEGIVARDQYSDVSIKWLLWEEYKSRAEGREVHIQHALNGGEVRIGNYRLDGCDQENRIAYEYCSCYYHGCECFDKDLFNQKVQATMWYLYQKTMNKKTYFEELGFTSIIKWDHEFQDDLKCDENLQQFLATFDIQPRLDPRQSFFGGRTNATRLFYEAAEGERIKYLDVTSLYPYVFKYKRYPVGYPEVITSAFRPISEYFGFIKAKVLAPRGLYHPVLPYRCGKLLFPLCRTCAENAIPKCTHNDEDRAMIGTWVSVELQYALEKGYKILNIYEVYHFPRAAQYDGKNPESGLFSAYINTFLTVKQQASGWPEWCQTDSDKDGYINSYREHEGVELDRDLIEKNPGLRSVAKLCLNSLWGKFAQRNDLPQTTFITEESQYFEHLTDPNKVVENFHLLSDEIALLQWRHGKDSTATGASSNVYIASFTTAYARLELYKLLEKLDRRVMYFDTDSVLFVSREGEYDPPLSVYLGGLTDELDGDDIQVFVAGSGKNYGYKTRSGVEVLKVRGFSLNFKNSQLINFDTVKNMVRSQFGVDVTCPCGLPIARCDICKPPTKITVVNENKITRDKLKFQIVNRREEKDYRLCYSKRVIQPDYDTLPFGF